MNEVGFILFGTSLALAFALILPTIIKKFKKDGKINRDFLFIFGGIIGLLIAFFLSMTI